MYVLTPWILKTLEILRNHAPHWISGRVTWRKSNDILWYPLIGESLIGASIGPVGDYISRQQNNVSQYIAMWLIYDIALVYHRIPGLPDLLYWWEQAGVQFRDLEGADENLELSMANWTYIICI